MRNLKKPKIEITDIACIAFLILSVLCCFPEYKTKAQKIGVNSSLLSLLVTEEDGLRSEMYVDAAENIAFAADKHFAIVEKQLDEGGRVISEYYYDEKGYPVELPEGQFGVLREYDEQGHETKVTYVDAEGEPKSSISGFVSILKEYDENGNEIKNIYTDLHQKPIYRIEGYAGRAKEYDENGRCIRITNLGIEGNPVNSRSGISIEERVLSKEGRVKKVMYYDADGRPVKNTLGQYGEAYEYDEHGRKYKTLFLDADGNVALNAYGYAILQKTFKADNNTDTEMYFDINGQPVKLSHGEYGVRWGNGRRYYLTKTGKVNHLLSLDELLHSNVFLSILVGSILCIVAFFLPKSFQIMLLLLYSVFIIYMTLMYRAGGNPEGQFELFWSYKEFFSDQSIRIELFQNIWLFVPLGALLYYSMQKRWVLALLLLFSAFIEITQYFTGRGLFEFDDMISNVLGGCFGFWIGKLVSKISMERCLIRRNLLI